MHLNRSELWYLIHTVIEGKLVAHLPRWLQKQYFCLVYGRWGNCRWTIDIPCEEIVIFIIVVVVFVFVFVVVIINVVVVVEVSGFAIQPNDNMIFLSTAGVSLLTTLSGLTK